MEQMKCLCGHSMFSHDNNNDPGCRECQCKEWTPEQERCPDCQVDLMKEKHFPDCPTLAEDKLRAKSGGADTVEEAE